MSKNSKSRSNKKQCSPIWTILFRFFIIVLIDILALSALCMYFYLTDRSVNEGYALILIAFSIVDFITAYYIGRKLRKKGMFFGIIYNLPVIALFLIISLILNGFSFDLRAIVYIILRIVISAIGGITAVNSKSKRK